MRYTDIIEDQVIDDKTMHSLVNELCLKTCVVNKTQWYANWKVRSACFPVNLFIHVLIVYVLTTD